jgi:hypothetical protein
MAIKKKKKKGSIHYANQINKPSFHCFIYYFIINKHISSFASSLSLL